MKYLASLLVLLAMASPAQARHRVAATPAPCTFFCFFQPAPAQPVVRVHHFKRRSARVSLPVNSADRRPNERPERRSASDLSEIVAHPPGCPHRAFCGCGAAVRVFGSPVRSLWLAANWYRFPRSSPAPGTVAIRSGGHHVMVLEVDLGGGIWQVYDANSGGHATRIHARSIAGYTIVSPR